MRILYDNLENHFIAPKVLHKANGGFYYFKRAPRKLKKKLKTIHICKHCDLNTLLWYYLGIVNPNYRNFLIKVITNKSKSNNL